MILSITSLKIKKWYYFFPVSYRAMNVMFQIKSTPGCVAYKTKGVGFETFTMTLWKSEEEMNRFYKTGAHKTAMQKAIPYAAEIKTLKISQNTLMDWKEAKKLLKNHAPLNLLF